MAASDLVECEGCRRHVRAGEGECPFCGASERAVLRAPRSVKGVTRAAIFAGAAFLGACGGSQTTAETTEETNTTPNDTGGEDTEPTETTDEVVEEGVEDGDDPERIPPAQPYGAPPFEDVLV